MELKELFLAQLEREAVSTRKAVERVPEGRNDWKPHEKSMELGKLAALVATMPGWIAFMIENDELDLDDPANEKFKTKALGSREELLRAFEEGVSKSRAALQGATEEDFKKNWRFKMGGRVLNDSPKYIVLSDSVFSHLAHHRGQLTVYLRLNDASVPAIYGPSADEFH